MKSYAFFDEQTLNTVRIGFYTVNIAKIKAYQICLSGDTI